ncbi:MAG: type IX secretion system membrane protein PorP/SprF, partial [Bacteroidota bacterium]
MKKLLIPVLLLTGSLAIAQDPIFSQFYATPLQINPGFAGSTGTSRIGTSYRNQWSGFNNAYRTYTVACDQNIERLNSGVGLLAETDDAGNGIYKTFR